MTQRSKKIAILIDQLVLGGVQKDAAYEVYHLNKLGHQAALLVLMRKGFGQKLLGYFPKIPLTFLSDSYPLLFKNSLKFPIFTFFSTLHVLSPFLGPRAVEAKKYDIIIAHGTTTCLTALAIWKKHHIPYIAIIPDPMEYILKKVYSKTPLRFFFWFISPILYFLEKEIIKNAQTVVVISEKHYEFIKKSYHTTPEILIPGTYTLPKLPKKRQSFLLASSRWEFAKNPELLLAIAKKLPHNNLIIAGNWTNQKDLLSFTKKIKKYHLEKRVQLKMNIKPADLTKLYSKALLYVHPNVEAFGLGGFEAASCGCPIVMPAGSGVGQILKDKKAGFFPKKTTVEEFFKPINFLTKNPQIAQKMGANAWNTITHGHSWQNHTKRLESLITSAIFKIDVVALEIGHAQGTVISGGDKLLEEMSNYLSNQISLSVIVPEIAAWHWQDKRAKTIKLKRNIFDNHANPFAVFCTYLLRILASTIIISKIPKKDVLYSSTNIFPDVIPSYLIKLFNPNIKWFARIHHLNQSPLIRPGNRLVNLASYLLQEISLLALKHRANLVAVLNQNLYSTLLKKGFAQDKLVTVAAGIDTAKWQTFKKTFDKKFEGIFLGRIHPTKGIFDLIPIWQDVCRVIPNARLVIIGQSTQTITKKLQSQINEANIAANVQIFGPLPAEKVKLYLLKSKIFLFTDHEAGFGLATLEAMAMGLPVIGYDIGILGKVFKEGYVKVPTFQTGFFAKNIVSLLQNDSKQLQLSAQAKTEAQKHSWGKISKDFEKLLANLKNT